MSEPAVATGTEGPGDPATGDALGSETAWSPTERAWLAGALAAVAVVVGLVVLSLRLFHPLAAAPAGFDTAFSVIYFDRIASGRLLEAFPSTTPKPLVTLLSGGLFAAGGWSLLWWATILAFALGVVATAAFARRFGGLVAAAMAVVGLAGSWLLLLDADLAYATPWALVGWSVAGLAVTSKRPRYAIAGLALLAAALCRAETFVLLGAATAAILGGHVLARLRLAPPPPPGAALLLVAWLAVPVMLLHDQLLVGDPLFWSKLPRLNATPNLTPRAFVDLTVTRYSAEWGLVALGAVGLVDLARRRLWVPLYGLLALGVGNLAFLLALAISRTYVSFRYFLPSDIALVVAASLGGAAAVAALAAVVVALLRRRPAEPIRAALGPLTRAPRGTAVGTAAAILAVATGAILAVALVRPFGPLDAPTRATFDHDATFVADFERALPVLRAQMAQLPAPEPVYAGPSSWGRLPPSRMAVPGLIWPRATVDLGVPLWYIASKPPVPADPTTFRLTAPIVVYFDRAVLTDEPRWRPLMVTSPTRVGHVLVEPVLADGDAWVERLVPQD